MAACVIDIHLVEFNVEEGTFGDPVMTHQRRCNPPIKNCVSGEIFSSVSPGAYGVTVEPAPCAELGTQPYYLRLSDNEYVIGSPTSSDVIYIGPNPQNYVCP